MAPTNSAPAPASGKKRRLQAAPAPYTNSFHFELLKSEILMQVFFGSHLPLYSRGQNYRPGREKKMFYKSHHNFFHRKHFAKF